MKKVLYIALEFPPQNNTGTYRTLKFVKYLPGFGVEPIVLTLTTESSEKIFGANSDFRLLDDLKGIEIHRVASKISRQYKCNFLNYLKIFFRLHDKIVNNWEEEVYSKIDTLITEHHLEAVIITFPPFSCLRLVNYIKKKFEIKVIIDFRDAWSAWGNGFFPTYLHYKLIQKLEKGVFKKADTIVTVTNELKEKFIQIHGEQIRNKIKVITNGFDFELEKEIIIKTPSILDNKTLRIGYIGSFYYYPKAQIDNNKPWFKRKPHRMWQYSKNEEDWKYRSPYYFLCCLKELLDVKPEMKTKIIFEHIGNTPQWLYTMINDLGLSENFYSHGFKTHEKVMGIAKEFDYLLATSEKNLVGPHYCLPSKLFDYVELNKPILAFVTNGSQKDFLINAGYSLIFDPDQINYNMSKIKELFENSKYISPNSMFLSKYNRKNITHDLSKLI